MRFELIEDEVHVWSVDLASAPEWLGREPALSAEEHERASRYVLARHRERFTAARATLRALLARYLGGRPGELVISSGAQGKPALDKVHGTDVCFNLSHSEEHALYALARRRELGVDIERMRVGADLQGIARRFFAPSEVDALRALPEAARERAFFTCWARKEAYVKARGGGLAIPLDGFDVNLGGRPALRSDASALGARLFTLVDLDAPPGFAAALAVEGVGFRLRFFALPERAARLVL